MESYRPNNLTKLQALIEEYGRLRDQQGFTPQGRGQRLNHFIAELFGCWDIEATASVRSTGEIDVAFELDGRQFIVEAKWERNRANIDPILKLRGRVRQRLGGTVGLCLSMSGFTSEAVKQLKEGEQLSVLLLSREHLEAMLAGFIPPPEMIRRVVAMASAYGEGFVSLPSLFEGASDKTLAVNFGVPEKMPNEPFIISSEPPFQANIVASNLPSDLLGLAVYSEDRVLLTLPQGIYTLDLRKQVLESLVKIPDCSGNVVVTEDGSILIARRIGVACLEADRRLRIVGGGFTENFRPVKGASDEKWVLSDGYRTRPIWGGFFATQIDDNVVITQLGEGIGREQRHTIKAGSASIYMIDAAYISDNRFLIMGSPSAIVDPSGAIQLVAIGQNNPKALARLTETRFMVASDGVNELAEFDASRTVITATHGVELGQFDTSTQRTTRVAQLNLDGPVVKLAGDSTAGGYLFTLYSTKGGEKAGMLIRWQYT